MLHVNALIAAKDEAYESLKGKLEAKEETITELHGRLADKDALIKEKDRTINLLQRMLEQMQDSSYNKTHTLLMAAEEES